MAKALGGRGGVSWHSPARIFGVLMLAYAHCAAAAVHHISAAELSASRWSAGDPRQQCVHSGVRTLPLNTRLLWGRCD